MVMGRCSASTLYYFDCLVGWTDCLIACICFYLLFTPRNVLNNRLWTPTYTHSCVTRLRPFYVYDISHVYCDILRIYRFHYLHCIGYSPTHMPKTPIYHSDLHDLHRFPGSKVRFRCSLKISHFIVLSPTILYFQGP
jgi:hypothetical protein